MIWGIITEKPKCDEVVITPNAKWSPVTPATEVKKEPEEGMPVKRSRTDDYQIRPQNEQQR